MRGSELRGFPGLKGETWGTHRSRLNQFAGFARGETARRYQRRPRVTGSSRVPAPTVAVPRPLGAMAEAGEKTSR